QGRGISAQTVIDAVVADALSRIQREATWVKATPATQAQIVEQTRTRITAWVYGRSANREGR
ncbi:MAG TPA: hypothetical protein VM536_02760, partial [Chloroflexia bacterium]|nr:hypothetical protein [Chloroflexia bacterium]